MSKNLEGLYPQSGDNGDNCQCHAWARHENRHHSGLKNGDKVVNHHHFFESGDSGDKVVMIFEARNFSSSFNITKSPVSPKNI